MSNKAPRPGATTSKDLFPYCLEVGGAVVDGDDEAARDEVVMKGSGHVIDDD